MSSPLSPPVVPLKPAARAERMSLVEREVRERLTSSAVDLLFARARVLSEGGRARSLPRSDGTQGPDPFFGSTMLTIDCQALGPLVREPTDEALAQRVATLLTTCVEAGQRARQIAEREACRIAGGPVETLATEVRVRAVGTRLHVDVDLEGRLLPGAAAADDDSHTEAR